jgi:hypothetical protein
VKSYPSKKRAPEPPVSPSSTLMITFTVAPGEYRRVAGYRSTDAMRA